MLPVVRRISDHTFLANLVGKQGALVVDLGMNSGAFSRDVLKLRADPIVYGCEPVPSLHERLFREFGARALNCAIGGKTEDSQITIYDHFCPSVVLRSLEDNAKTIPVRIVAFDELIARLALDHIDLLKVDIEGSELAMLQNSSAASLQKCDQITVEFHDFIDPTHLPAIHACIARLESLGFVMFRCSISSYSDVLFIHKRRLGFGDAVVIRIAIFLKNLNLLKARNFARRLIGVTGRGVPALKRQ